MNAMLSPSANRRKSDDARNIVGDRAYEALQRFIVSTRSLVTWATFWKALGNSKRHFEILSHLKRVARIGCVMGGSVPSSREQPREILWAFQVAKVNCEGAAQGNPLRISARVEEEQVKKDTGMPISSTNTEN